MRRQKFIKRTEINASVERVFAFHERPEAFNDLVPPWEKVEIVQTAESLRPGTQTIIRTFIGPLSRKWVAEHTEYEANRLFADVQRSGPFAWWYHRHRFEPTDHNTTIYTDEVEYALPMGWLGEIIAGRMVRRKLERMFEYRHRIVAEKMARPD